MAEGDESTRVTAGRAVDIQHIREHLDILEQRLDNIDTMVSAVAERVMSHLITINITCPHCGKDIEMAIVSSQKPRR